jgi:hypothetical protein
VLLGLKPEGSHAMHVTGRSASTLGKLGRPLRALLLGWLAPLALVVVVVQLLVYRETSVPGLAPRPAGGLHELAGEAELQARFAQDSGHPRLLLLISPT